MTDYTTSQSATLVVTNNSRVAPGVTIGSYSTNTAILVDPGVSLRLDGNALASAIGIQGGAGSVVTITPTGGVVSDVYGVLVASGTIYNYGGIFCEDNGGTGADIQGSGSIYNYGVIAGGVILNDSGNAGAATSLLNSGSISGSVLSFGGTSAITNNGSITATDTIVQYLGGVLSLTNNGTIRGDRPITAAAGVQLSLDNRGTISGTTYGVVSNALDDTVVNRGLIVAGIDLGEGADTYEGAFGRATATIELRGGADTAAGGSYREIIDGGDGDDSIDGGGGNDVLNGGADNDTLDGGAGIDAMTGGTGNDTFFVDNVRDTTAEAADQGDDTVYAAVSYALGAGQSIEHLVADPAIGEAAINLTGNELTNELIGNDGTNRLDGKVGADTMIGHDGNDTYVVDDAGDIVTEAANEGYDTVLAMVDYALAPGEEIEVLRAASPTATVALHLVGNEIANYILGNAGNNLIDGGAGGDVMRGGLGGDTYIVDDAGDIVVELVGQGTDTVQASVSYVLTNNVENLTLTGADAIDGTGNIANNQIIGNSVANTLDGKAGNDTLTGGGGNDVFLFDTALNAATNVDSITDFARGADHIGLDARYFRGIVDAGGSMSAANFTDGAPTTKDQHILYDAGSGTLSYDRDGVGAAFSAVAFAHVTVGTVLDHNDFQVL